MAIACNVSGRILVTYDTVQLGYTRDGASVRLDPRWGDVFSDDYGGQGGAPADSQLLGATADIRCELTKYEQSEILKLTSFEESGTAGTLPAYGSLVRQDGLAAVLLLDGLNETYTFSTAFLRQAQEFNAGTKFTTFMIGFEAWVDAATTRLLMARAAVP